MTRRERVRNAVLHRAPDRCPHNVELTGRP